MSTSNKRGRKRPAEATTAGRPVKIGAGAARADPPSRLSAHSAAGGLPEDATDPQPRQNGGGSGGGAAAARPRRMKKAREIGPIAACSAAAPTAPLPKQEYCFAAVVLFMEDKGTLAAICNTFRVEKQAAFYYVGLFREGEVVYTSQQVDVAVFWPKRKRCMPPPPPPPPPQRSNRAEPRRRRSTPSAVGAQRSWRVPPAKFRSVRLRR